MNASIRISSVACIALLSGCACAPKPVSPVTAEIRSRVFIFAELPETARILECRSEPVSNHRQENAFRYPYGAFIEACSFEISPEQFIDLVPAAYYGLADDQRPTDANRLIQSLANNLPAPMIWRLNSWQNLQVILADASHRHGIVLTTYCRCGRSSSE